MYDVNSESDIQDEHSQYKDLIAVRLYCSNCRASMPVRERLLLVLPDGYLYEYFCTECGDVLGDKKVSLQKKDRLLF